jgi:hypothetical protein
MGVEINVNFSNLWSAIIDFGTQNPIVIATQLFLGGGWVIFLLAIVYALYRFWLGGRQAKFAGKWKHVMLAIDIPKENEQTPKAVENIFIALAATQSSGNLLDQFWHGKVQESFSFEIVSLEGYVQFIVRTPNHFRDLIEAAIYAQYPEAEIVEVDDYTENYKDIKFPDETYDLWGTEMVLIKDYPYPIKTYPDFEHKLTGELIDPMAALLEILSRIGNGEQIWMQFVVTPSAPGWGEKGKQALKEMKGEPYTAPETVYDKMWKPVGAAGNVANAFSQEIFGAAESGEKKEDDQWRMFKLTPGERLVSENVNRKLSKHSFRAKFRFIYFGEKTNFSKGRGVAAVIGAIQQFNTADSNGFKPGPRSKTGADYFQVAKRTAIRQSNILKAYASRSGFLGDEVDNMLFSSEELASLWHFPVLSVKAPSVEKIGSRRSVPPSRLPYAVRSVESTTETKSKPDKEASKEELRAPGEPQPPANLPTI